MRETRRWILTAAALLLGLALPAAAQYVVESNQIYHLWSPSVAYDYYSDWMVAGYTDNDTPGNSVCWYANSCTANVTSRRLNGSGSVQGEQVIAHTDYEAQKDPAIAFNPDRSEYLVVYYDNTRGDSTLTSCGYGGVNNNSDIYGYRLNVYGQKISGRIDISGSGYYSWHNVRPKVAYNRTSRRYMVVWQTAPVNDVCNTGIPNAPWRVRGRMLDEYGNPATGVFGVSNVQDTHESPDVAAHSSNDRFMVVWQDRRYGSSPYIFGQLLNSNGQILFPSWDLIVGATSNNDRFPAVIHNPHDDQWLATWYAATGSYDQDREGPIMAQRLRGYDGYWIGGHFQIWGGNGGHPKVVYCTATQRYWVAFQGSGNAYVSTFNRSLGGLSVWTLASNAKAPSLPDACHPSSGKVPVVWEQNNYSPYYDLSYSPPWQGLPQTQDIYGTFLY
jgi:hypothetical protein